MRDRYSYSNSYQQGGAYWARTLSVRPSRIHSLGHLRRPLPSPTNPPNPPIMGQSLPDAGMKSGVMGAVTPQKPKFTPKQYEQEAKAKKSLRGYGTGPAGSLMGGAAPQAGPAGQAGQQGSASQGNQWLSSYGKERLAMFRQAPNSPENL